KQAHRDQGKNQNEGEPEEHRIKESLLDGVLHLALIHERDLEVKIDAADDQKKDHHDVSDRRVEIAAHLARQQGPEFTHRFALLYLLQLDLIRMCQLNEHILECAAPLSEFAHGPVAFHG